MKPLDRIFLLVTALLASYQVVRGIDGLGTMAITCYTIGFGIIVIASLMMMILGFDVFDSPLVLIGSTVIPLCFALGLVAEFLQPVLLPFSIFIAIGLAAIIVTRFVGPKKLAVIVLALVHGVSGATISVLPIVLVVRATAPGGLAFVGVGGVLFGSYGLLISFLKAGKPILPREKIQTLFPSLPMLGTIAFVIGFAFA